MISSSTISYFFGFWVLAYLLDAGLSNHPYTRQKYLELRENSGISIQVLQARFFTQKLNPLFKRIGEVRWFPWSLWFFAGTAFSAVFMVLSVVILFFLAYNTTMRKPIEQQVITPVMPGVNLPMSQLGFYLLTLLVCVVLHEAGHALAALHERVRIHGFGFFLIGIYPGAYVDISDADLNSLSPIRQLKIYSAGVWHNGVIVVLSIICFYALPWTLSPAYVMNQGVGIVNLQKNSVFTGPRGLHLGDAITQVNSCPVNTPAEWFRCLEEASTKVTGYCVSNSFIGQHPPPAPPGLRHLAAVVPLQPLQQPQHQQQNVVNGQEAALPGLASQDCCPSHLASTHLCFTYMASGINAKRPRQACLPARAVTEKEACSVPSDCGRVAGAGGPMGVAGVGESAWAACLVPAQPDNTTRLIRIVHNRERSPAVLFFGPVEELLSSVEISDYVPRWPQITPCRLPEIIATFCRYLFSLSGALVMFNVVPCYALDGQGIFKSLLELALPPCVCSRQIRRLIFSTTLWMGTGLVFLNIALALCYLLL
ncbi:membrane bound transcription factor site 2 [Echinococcus multilocularis]|uniref:Membrane-bound transcription factor site-2 protease n=1 Tax=Echinococcus multilocularis TaxID=6211 RepID=A0A068XZ32_ECHMU|nr:membrane bound transcription factor site 2 [Echinococcus multilocularis]